MEIVTWNKHSIKQILLNHRDEFIQLNWKLIRSSTFEAVNKVLFCWSESLWFATYKCSCCNEYKHISFTCKSRFCNSCWKPQSDLRFNRLLSRRPPHIDFFHIAFTIPTELRPFFKDNRKALILLQQAASQSILYFFHKKYKCTPWLLSVIHTFWAKLNRNPHVHFILTAWGTTQSLFFNKISFLPYKGIIASWKMWLLRLINIRIKSNLSWSSLKIRSSLINSLYKQIDNSWNLKSWYIYFSPKPHSFNIVLSYIWRYLKRPVISQSRILDYNSDSVTFSYIDKYDKQKKVITCSPLDFIWLLIQHIPNKHFKLVFYSWIFANRCKSKYLRILNSRIKPFPTSFRDRFFSLNWKDPFDCPCWWYFYLHTISIPWYPTKFFNSS